MAEQYPEDVTLNALDGTVGSTGLPHATIGQEPWYTWLFKLCNFLDRTLAPLNALRVFKDGDLTFGVYAGAFASSTGAKVTYAGATEQALVDDATNYIYLADNGTLTVNQAGFPNPAVTPHVPLATIVCADGAYAISSLTDNRAAAMYRVLTA